MKIRLIFLTLSAIALLGMLSCTKEEAPALPDTLTLRAQGQAQATPVTKFIPGLGITVEGTAYTIDVYNVETGKKAGSLTDIDVAAEEFPDGSMRSETYTIFSFYGSEDKIVLNSFIEAIPVDEVSLRAFIKPENAKDNIVGGVGKYAGVTGGCSLEATLDATQFGDGIIGFDCLYEMSFNK